MDSMAFLLFLLASSKFLSSLSQYIKEYVGESCSRFTFIASFCVASFAFSVVCVANHALSSLLHYVPCNSRCIFTSALLLISIGIFCAYQNVRPLRCYLVDFCCTKGDDRDFASITNFFSFLRTWRSVTDGNLKFQLRIFLRSGIGEEAYAPPMLLQKGKNVDMQDARVETENLISDAVHKLLQKNGIDPHKIDIVIVNSSLFNPVPSLSAYVVNVLSMRSNVKSFNLAGMGCAGSLIAIDLASHLLKVRRNSYALVVSTENITKNFYFGNDRSMMVSNCLFRCGCSAILLTNKTSARTHAKMELRHCLRTTNAADDKAYGCVQQMEDSAGKLGISLQVSLIEVAHDALRTNITKLAPSIISWSEMIKVVINLARRRLVSKAVGAYQPDFKKAIDHFCIHPGGRNVIDAVKKGLKLSEFDVEPGRMALERFGNTSSSGIWYALAYCEAKGRLKRGNKLWQIALGSGFKCNSAVWHVLRDIEPSDNMVCNPWLSCIDWYPIPANVIENQSAKSEDIEAVLEMWKQTESPRLSNDQEEACP